MDDEKAISLPVRDLEQLKIMLAAWYAYLKEASDNFSRGEFSRYLKTPVIYDIANDRLEILFTGDEDLLKRFKDHVLNSNP